MKREAIDTSNNNQDQWTQEYLRLFLASQKRILGFIRTMVPHLPDAEDILQDTAMVMWEKFDDFEEGTDFGAWAISIARFRTLKFHEKKKYSGVHFSDTVFREIIAANQTLHEKMDQRIDALEHCVMKLTKKDRDLISMKYDLGLSTKEMAEKIDKSIHSAYKGISRIHELLSNCVKLTLSNNGGN